MIRMISGWPVMLVLSVLALTAGGWLLSAWGQTVPTDQMLVGRPWSQAIPHWGMPVCRAAGAHLTARESAARRAPGTSALVVPHDELLLVEPSMVHGPSAGSANRILVFTEEDVIVDFLERHGSGDLADYRGETRVAIDRSSPVRVVELDPLGRVAGLRMIRPVFVTVQRR